MSMIAGHLFVDSSTGRRCMTRNNAGELCYRSWLFVRCACKEDIGKPNIAHNGALNLYEFSEIECERKREIEDVWQAVIDAASAGSR